MNNFAEIVFIEKYKKVTFYSIAINDGDVLYDAFVKKQWINNKEKLNHILAWINKIGDKTGALDHYFRNEAETADARALPPIGKEKHPTYVEVNEDGKHETMANNLRLYCMRVSNQVVILFNGDIKTTQKAQDCPSVKPHFKLANKLTNLINESFASGDIRWNNDYSEIELDENFLLEWD